MAKAINYPSKVVKYPYASRFGSHESMVVKDNCDGTVVCKDEFGEYTTEIERIDDNLADPHRYAEKRLGKLFASKKEKE